MITCTLGPAAIGGGRQPVGCTRSCVPCMRAVRAPVHAWWCVCGRAPRAYLALRGCRGLGSDRVVAVDAAAAAAAPAPAPASCVRRRRRGLSMCCVTAADATCRHPPARATPTYPPLHSAQRGSPLPCRRLIGLSVLHLSQ